MLIRLLSKKLKLSMSASRDNIVHGTRVST